MSFADANRLTATMTSSSSSSSSSGRSEIRHSKDSGQSTDLHVIFESGEKMCKTASPRWRLIRLSSAIFTPLSHSNHLAHTRPMVKRRESEPVVSRKDGEDRTRLDCDTNKDAAEDCPQAISSSSSHGFFRPFHNHHLHFPSPFNHHHFHFPSPFHHHQHQKKAKVTEAHAQLTDLLEPEVETHQGSPTSHTDQPLYTPILRPHEYFPEPHGDVLGYHYHQTGQALQEALNYVYRTPQPPPAPRRRSHLDDSTECNDRAAYSKLSGDTLNALDMMWPHVASKHEDTLSTGQNLNASCLSFSDEPQPSYASTVSLVPSEGWSLSTSEA